MDNIGRLLNTISRVVDTEADRREKSLLPGRLAALRDLLIGPGHIAATLLLDMAESKLYSYPERAVELLSQVEQAQAAGRPPVIREGLGLPSQDTSDD